VFPVRKIVGSEIFNRILCLRGLKVIQKLRVTKIGIILMHSNHKFFWRFV
jgi:hypothetical protein